MSHSDFCRASLKDVTAAILTLVFFAALLDGFGWIGLFAGVWIGLIVLAVCMCVQGAYEDRLLAEWQERQR